MRFTIGLCLSDSVCVRSHNKHEKKISYACRSALESARCLCAPYFP